MRLSPRFKLSCSFAQRAAVCPLIIAPAFKRRTIALCPKQLTWPRHFFSPRLRKYARSPALCAPAGKPFLMAKPPLPCRKIFACACLPALFAFSSPWFFSFPPFLSICFGQIPEAFYPQSSCRFSLVRRKAALFAPAVFHAPRPFKQTYAPLFSLFPHRAKPSVSLKPRRVPALPLRRRFLFS